MGKNRIHKMLVKKTRLNTIKEWIKMHGIGVNVGVKNTDLI